MTPTGTLYIVATPIGHLGDMSPRAIATLQAVTLIAAEDTRHSLPLLRHFGIHTPCVSYHDHNEREQAQVLVDKLLGGIDIALISDAGTPLLADPGYRLVNAAHVAGVRVVPVPGPCALTAMLSVAGLATDRFIFEGFLPAQAAARKAHLNTLVHEMRTLVFYEAPHRIADTLADLATIFGAAREAAVARELTKHYETLRHGTLATLAAWLQDTPAQQRGEFVLAVSGASAIAQNERQESHARNTLILLLAYLSPSRAAAVTAQLTGIHKNRAYQMALELTKSLGEQSE